MNEMQAEIELAADKMKLWGKDIEEKLGRALVQGMLKITAQAKRLAPKDTGHLAQSIIVSDVQHEEGKLTVIGGPTVQYGALVEYGTGPHVTNQGHDDFIRSIELWARRKGMNAEQTQALIHHIQLHGTKPHPYLGPAYYQLLAEVKSDIKAALE
jgi:HK97 gp10 family phage protein